MNERGEAPPPYVPGSKPPSIRSIERRQSTSAEHARTQDVRLGNINRSGNDPPGYHEQPALEAEGAVAGIMRPTTAVPASERFGSMRMLLDSTGSSTQP